MPVHNSDVTTVLSTLADLLEIDQARRGWLQRDDVINTRSWRELKRLLKRN
jgi:DNA polymerase (family 10)